jgi:HlyD family secretion protein
VKKIIIGIITLMLITTGAYLAIYGGAANPTMAQSTTPIASTTKQDGPVLAEGKVVPARSVALNFVGSGVVAEVLVKEGDTIEKGAPLARLDTRDLELKVGQAEAALALAQAGYDKLVERASPLEIAVMEAQLAQAQANLRQTRGNVTQQDIVAARAALEQAKAALAQLEAGPKSTQIQAAQATLDQAQANLQSQRDGLSATKTNTELQMQQAAADLTKAQAAYATASENWQYVQDTGNNPVSPTSVGTDGKAKANKLNDTQRQQYYDAFIQAEATMRSAESAVQQAQITFDNARQAEITGIRSAEAQVRSSQASLDQTRAHAEADQLAAARAQVAQAQANLNKLLGEQRAGNVDAAAAGVASAEARLAELKADPRASELASAQAQVQAAEVGLKEAKVTLEKATLVAPMTGMIAQINLKVGEAPSATNPAVILADLAAWQIETTDLTELSIGRIKVGDPAKLTFEALPSAELTGKVIKIATIGQNKQGDITYTVTVEPDFQEARLRWNMTSTVGIMPK